MEFALNKNDRKLLVSIAEHKVLTVKQISGISQRSCPVVRRRIRVLEMEGLIILKMHGYGRSRGRPEDLIFLTEKGAALLEDGRIPSGNAGTQDKADDPFSLDHLLLINWFRIHLLQIERLLPQVSVHYLSPNSNPLALNTGDNFSFSERIPVGNRPEKFIQFIPDGVFSIKSKGPEEKTLLFFLEADMGTETIAGTNQNPKDIRQKVLNYQELFRSGSYKRYEGVFNSKLNGFRLLFLVNSPARLTSLSRLVREMPPSDFIWLTAQQRMFSSGLSAKIWTRGGRNDEPPQSILGPKIACDLPLFNSNA